MVIFVNTKDGKVDITKKELEKLLKEEFDKGYSAGAKTDPPIYTGCPYSYWNCPYKYWYYPSNTPSIMTPNIVWTSDSTTTAAGTNDTIKTNTCTAKLSYEVN